MSEIHDQSVASIRAEIKTRLFESAIQHRLANKFDGLDANSMFSVFSKDNPHATEADKLNREIAHLHKSLVQMEQWQA